MSDFDPVSKPEHYTDTVGNEHWTDTENGHHAIRKNQTVGSEESNYVPIEKYTLILKHEYVDKDGKYLVDQPLMVSSVAPLQKGMSIVPVNVMIQKMIQDLTERMKYEAVREYMEEEE